MRATPTLSPLERQLHDIRFWIVVTINGAFMLYALVTAALDPEPLTWSNIVRGDHTTRYLGFTLCGLGLVATLCWPQHVRRIYIPYLMALLAVTVVETRGMVRYGAMPFHLALWLCVNMAAVFMVYGARRGLWVFGAIVGAVVVSLLSVMPIRGYLLIDWMTTLIVMALAGAISYLLISLIESHLLINERTIEELRSARIDAVTGLWGRASIEQRMAEQVGATRAAGQPISVVVGDLDHFKGVNDRYGHKRGDEVLRAFAAELRRHADPVGGLVGRWGGEEFMLVLPGQDGEQATALAETICQALGHQLLAGVPVSASFGVSSAAPTEPGVTPDTLFTAADRALYQAKNDGRACVRRAA